MSLHAANRHRGSVPQALGSPGIPRHYPQALGSPGIRIPRHPQALRWLSPCTCVTSCQPPHNLASHEAKGLRSELCDRGYGQPKINQTNPVISLHTQAPWGRASSITSAPNTSCACCCRNAVLQAALTQRMMLFPMLRTVDGSLFPNADACAGMALKPW